jgi:hypothetical protein
MSTKRRSRAIYVETLIRADLAALWDRTQLPASHQRWDLRFHHIAYAPRGTGGTQRFRYCLRPLPGLVIAGYGSTVGERDRPDGTRTSALRFASADRLSLIRSGSGYWRYIPCDAGIRFLTGYQYRPGWGRLGPAADLVFRPFLALGSRRNILFPDTGLAVPFVIENYPYLDSFGRETVTFVRTFRFPAHQRRFDATMIYSSARGCVVDYLGTHQHLATDLLLRADERGGLVIRSGAHRFHQGPLALRVPGVVAGAATVRESFDEEIGRFRIDVHVTSRRFGPLFGYHGTFTTCYVGAGGVPATVKPRREQARC